MDDGPLDAGAFAAWREAMLAVLAGGGDAAVPCGSCSACCRSSQFVSVGPDETDALSHIPAELLFPAPRRPGYFVLGYDGQGRCPMLAGGRCSIYNHRPRACRSYDCRVLAAAGLMVDTPAQADVGRQVRRWRFAHPAPADRQAHAGVRAAAAFLADHPDVLPAGESTPATLRAVLAVEIGGLFPDGASPGAEAVRAEMDEMEGRR